MDLVITHLMKNNGSKPTTSCIRHPMSFTKLKL